jgi:D-alanine-D-alanine ligase
MVTVQHEVAVVFGGPSPEHDVSILTGLQAVHALAASARVGTVHPIFWTKTGEFYEVSPQSEATAFADGAVPKDARLLELALGPDGGFVASRARLSGRAQRLDIAAVVVCCHGGPGEDGSLQGTFDLAGLAYSGPSAASAALGMDKLASGAVLSAAGLPTLERVLLADGEPLPQWPGPYIVKPRFGGSSIGIAVVEDYDSALALERTSVHLRRGAVIEPYRPELTDLQVAVRSFPTTTLSEIERPIRRGAGEILDYADKYVAGEGMAGAPRELPAVLEDGVGDRLRELALRAAALLGARGVARIDFLAGDGELYVNEINTVPGSLSRYLFIDPPLSFEQLLIDLLTEATERPAAQFSSAGATGLVLRDAQSIAAKLA